MTECGQLTKTREPPLNAKFIRERSIHLTQHQRSFFLEAAAIVIVINELFAKQKDG